MKEEYLHHAYALKIFGRQFLSHQNKPIEILEFGELNTNAGPDFLDAKIKYDAMIWTGAIEFHVNASDWYKHKHQNDPAYGNVIAHFVLFNDKQVFINKFEVPTVELNSKIDTIHYEKYKNLLNSKAKILCKSELKNISPEIIAQQLAESLNQRLWQRSIKIITNLEENNGDLQKAYFFSLARTFGGTVNQIPFEQLVDRLNLKWFAKLNYDPFRMEALLFGLSGILPVMSKSQYVQCLISEFNYQKKLFDIGSLPKNGWRYSRMRPSNFPDIRIAQFAAFIANAKSISFLLRDNWSVKDFKNKQNIQLNPFWKNHFRLEKKTDVNCSVNLSNNMLDLILINAVVPTIYAIGFLEGNEIYKTYALKILKQIKPENNNVLTEWKKAGLSAKSAFESQSLLELKKQGCNQKKCLFCTVGKSILKR